MKLSCKLFLFFLAVLTATLGAAWFFAGRAVDKAITEQIAGRLAGDISGLGPQLHRAFAAGKEDTMLPVLQKLQRQSGALYVAAIKPDGFILAHTNVAMGGKRAAAPGTLKALRSAGPLLARSVYRSDPALEVTSPFSWSGDVSGEALLMQNGAAPRPVGVIKAALPLAPAIRAEREIRTGLLAAILAVYLGGLAIAVLFLRVALEQVRLLKSAMTGVSGAEAGKPVRVVSGDELGALAEAFNAMREKLLATSVSKDYLNSILERMPDPLVIADPSGKILKLNRAAAEIAGPAVKRLGDLLEEPANAAKSVLGKLEGAGTVTESDLWLLAADGRRIPVLFSASCISNKDDSPPEILAVLKDITQHKVAEYRLRTYVREIETANRELDSYAHSISHDLKEPMRSIEMMSNIALEDYGARMEPPLKDLLERIIRSASRGMRLIDDLLTYSRIARERSPYETADTGVLAAQAAKTLEYLAEEKKARITFVSKLPELQCDPAKLRQVFYNLISNALKYNDNPEPVIAIGAQKEGACWSFFVRDNGIGMDPKYFGDIFKIFKRLHGRGKYGGGSGIGLAIVEKIILEHKGHLRVESEPGKGSTFFFLLPVSQKEEK